MVIKNPLKDDPDSHQSALGILAYLESFLSSQGVSEVYSEQHLKTMKASLDAEYGKLTFKIAGLRWFCGILLGVYYFVGRVLFSWESLSEWELGNLIYLIILGVSLLVMMQKTKILDYRRNKIYLELMKIVPYYKMRSTIILILLFAASTLLAYAGMSEVFALETVNSIPTEK